MEKPPLTSVQNVVAENAVPAIVMTHLTKCFGDLCAVDARAEKPRMLQDRQAAFLPPTPA